MAQATRIELSHREIIAAILREQGINAGFWSLLVRFDMSAMNVSVNGSQTNPAAVLSVASIGLVKVDGPGQMVVDAATLDEGSGSMLASEPARAQ